MTGRVGRAPDRGASTIGYVGLGVLATGAVLGVQQSGYTDGVAAQIAGGVCGILRLADCATSPSQGTPQGTERHRTGAQPADGGWSGVGRRPESIPHLPVPLVAGGAAVFVAFWWNIPRRLRRKTRHRVPDPIVAGPGSAAPEPGPADAAHDAHVAIAGIDPGIAGKGMRVGVRACEITLRPGPRGTVRLDKTLARTSGREFAVASRTVRRSLRDPGFVAELLDQTGRAAAYLDGNPQLAGAAARRAELTELTGALEGLGHGSSR